CRGKAPAQVWAAAQRNTSNQSTGNGKNASFQADDAVRPRRKRQVPGAAQGTTSLHPAIFPSGHVALCNLQSLFLLDGHRTMFHMKHGCCNAPRFYIMMFLSQYTSCISLIFKVFHSFPVLKSDIFHPFQPLHHQTPPTPQKNTAMLYPVSSIQHHGIK
ncbi:MAG: hypothetical protein ACI4MJ_04170, partial [Aristaeellaceae bacterium]